MPNTKTLFIVPAFSEFGGQCRIVAATGDYASPIDNYRANPQLWHEVGIMDSKGSIRCIESEFSDIKNDEPLMAGMVFKFNIGEVK